MPQYGCLRAQTLTDLCRLRHADMDRIALDSTSRKTGRMTPTKVQIRTADAAWIARRAVDSTPPVDGYSLATIVVEHIERVTFAGRSMVRFDLGADAPADHNRHAMYPAAYVVAS